MADKEKLLDDLWNILHNPNKVNINLLSEADVGTLVKAMLRDQTENMVDMNILDDAEMSNLNYETIQGYRN